MYLWTSPARQMIAAAEPSDTPEQSKIPRFPATSGDAAIASFATSFLNCARGLSAPLGG